MASIARSAEVAAAPEWVFDYLAAGEHVGEWLPDLLRSERLTPGPVVPGTRFLYVFRVLGRSFEIVNEVTALERPTLVGFRAAAGVANRGQFEVESLDGGQRSRVTLTFAFDLPPGPIGAIVRRLPVAAIVDRYTWAAMRSLISRLESLGPEGHTDSSR